MDWMDFFTRVVVPITAVVTAIASLRKLKFEGKGIVIDSFEAIVKAHVEEIARLNEKLERREIDHQEEIKRIKEEHQRELRVLQSRKQRT